VSFGFSKELLQEILAALTPEQVYGGQVKLRKVGKEFVGTCYFHSEKSGSFHVKENLRFKCWGCQKQGSAFDFIMEVNHIDFPAAVRFLAAEAGIPLNGSAPKYAYQKPGGQDETSAPAITVEDLARDKKIPISDLTSLGLKDCLNGVLIPYRLTDGSLAPRQRIRKALTAKEGSKWDNEHGPIVPYGLWKLEKARGAGFLDIVEGESDTWTLWHHDMPCLGIPGAGMTGCLEAEHLTGIPKVYIVREPGTSGETFVTGLAKRLGEIGWKGQAFVVSLAPFKDPNELHKSNPELFLTQFLDRLNRAELLNLDTVGVFGQLASEVQPKRVEWLWPGRIPLGKVTVLDGDPSLGKSAITLDLAARVTTGRSMPDGSPSPTGGVLVLNAEDEDADTIVPRLKAMGARLDRVRILKILPDPDGERQPEIPGDLAAIEKAARSVGAKLIIIDPIMAFLGGRTNSFRDQDVRRALAPLARLAERLGVAIVIVRHLNKNTGEQNSLYRGGGSIGIIGAARSGLLVARNPDDETGEARILASTKANLGRLPTSLGYSIQTHGASICVAWTGESAYRAADLLAVLDREERSAVQDRLFSTFHS
jgi:hypothetical protein